MPPKNILGKRIREEEKKSMRRSMKSLIGEVDTMDGTPH